MHRMTDSEFESAVEEALGCIPEQFLDALVDERWVFEVEQEKGEVGLGDTHVRVVR